MISVLQLHFMYDQASCKPLMAATTNDWKLLLWTDTPYDASSNASGLVGEVRSHWAQHPTYSNKITACTSYLTKKRYEKTMLTAVAVGIIHLYLADGPEIQSDSQEEACQIMRLCEEDYNSPTKYVDAVSRLSVIRDYRSGQV